MYLELNVNQTKKEGDKELELPLENWIDNQDVMDALHISARTLQTLRSNGSLPYSRIGNKLYYQKKDLVKMLADKYERFKSNFDENK